MTVDLATLNLKIDSTQVAQGVGQLDKLTAAGTRAEQSTDRLGREFVKAGSAAGALRMEEARLEAEVQRLIAAHEKAEFAAKAQAIAQERLGQTVVRSAGAQRAGMQQLSYQVGDMATMFAMGARPMQIFASQGGQVLQSVQLMSGASKGFVGFLAGPWGMAITSAAVVLGSLIASTQEEEAAIEDLNKAFNFAAMSANQLAQVNGLLADSNREVAETAIQAARAMGARAQANATNAAAELRRAEAELDRQMQVTRNGGGIWTAGAAGPMADRTAALRTTIAGLRREVRDATADVAIMTAGLSEQEAAVEALTARQNDLRNEYVRTGNTGALEQAVALQGQIDALADSTDKATGASRRRRVALTAEQRAEQQATRETDRYIASLEEEYARLTMSQAAFRAREVALHRATATTDEQREAIDRLSASIAALQATEEARTQANERQAKVDQYAQQYQDKIKAEAEVQQEIEEEARKLGEERIRDLASLYETLFTDGVDGVWDVFKKQGLAAIATLASQMTLNLLSGGGAGGSNPLASVMSILGGSAANDNAPASIGSVIQSVLGSSGVGGSAGGAAGMQSAMTALAAVPGLGQALAAVGITQGIGEGIEKLTGLRFDMLGGLFGGVIGGFAVGALKGAVKGNATIGGSGSALSVVDSFGKNKFKQAAIGDAGSVIDILGQIADGLGIDLSASAGSVSIGTRNGKYRVDPLGGGAVSTKKGAIDFGKDQQAAIEYAIRDLIQDGVLGGISQAAKNLLGAGGDLEKAIEQAMMIESVPKLLKQRLDPLNYELDTIDERFGSLVEALRAGGATAQQFADAENLYNLEREEAIAQIGSAAQTLKDFAASLAYGSNSPLSVRSQLASAEAAFAPFQQAIMAGQSVDQDKFTSAAQTLLGLSRQANGSSGAYFQTFDRINSLTQQAIGNIESTTTAQGPGVVFQQQTASNTASMAAMLQDHTALLRSIDAKLANDNGDEKTTKIGKKRGFAV